MRLPIEQISARYAVRPLAEADLPAILALCRGNPTYYEHMRLHPTLENLAESMTALPPGKGPEDKYFLGCFWEGRLLAVLDLIAAYPDLETAFLGWFILDKAHQGAGNGTALLAELLAFCKAHGFRYMRLGYIKGNPESERFWHRNRFAPTGVETGGGGYTVVVMQKKL